MKHIILAITLVSLGFTFSFAQNPRADFASDIKQSASNYYAYPTNNLQKLSPAPAGYQPFYIDHYGRHGSRWLIQESQYGKPVEYLAKAEKYGKLTPKGVKVLNILREIKDKSSNRLGELTDVGAEQHQGIAHRMYLNFPEVFADSAEIDARSTIVIRCILSMSNECQELKAMNPKLKIKTDASYADMYYMNFNDTSAARYRKLAYPIYDKFEKSLINPARFINQLISDKKFADDSINAATLMTNLFDVTSNMQSHHFNYSLYDLFSSDEIYNLWQCKNAYWYLFGGNSPLTEGRMPYIERNLLKNMIESADAAIIHGKNCADLRFGHESCLLPLACLMELDNYNVKVLDLKDLASAWQNYKIFPMACNIQMVFYKKPGSADILVKILLNEHEATLPIQSDIKPYYHWSDLRSFYLDKLTKFNN